MNWVLIDDKIEGKVSILVDYMDLYGIVFGKELGVVIRWYWKGKIWWDRMVKNFDELICLN